MNIKTDTTYILNFAPTGMIPTKEQTPHVPIAVNEIVEQTLEAAEQGITMVHLHARDPKTGLPTYKAEVYAQILEGIRRFNKELIIGISTSGRDFNTFEKRSQALNLDGAMKPDFASLTLSSLNFNRQASVNSPEMIQQLVSKMAENEIRPEMEVFDQGMINYARYLIRKQLIKPPFYFNFILGNIACAQANLLSLGMMENDLPEDSYWSVGAVGNPQLKMNIIGIASGGGVRVGLEDNIWMDEKRTTLATNSGLLKRVIAIGDTIGKRPMSPTEARILLELSSTKGEK